MLSKNSAQIFTYQTRIEDRAATSAPILQDCATLLSSVERSLFADISSGKQASDLKSLYLQRYKISARHFNAIRIQLEGKIASISEKQTDQISTLEHKIKTLEKRLTQLKKSKTTPEKLHQKKRHLFNLQQKLNQLNADKEKKRIRLCFGSKRLFRAQFHLKANGYQNHEEWSKDWQQSRKNSFFLVGSKDETSGNQLCTATANEAGNINLRVRLPDAFQETHGKYLALQNLHFNHGHQKILDALKATVALSYRFVKDDKSWTVFVSVPIAKAEPVTTSQNGVIGVDINANHLAIAETDPYGNPISKKTIPYNSYGKTSHQTKAIIGDVCTKIVLDAKRRGKDLVIERLDFRKKKAELKEQSSPKLARMLSSLSYTQFKNNFKSKSWQEGVVVHEVNPAFTSIIGRVKFAKRYGLTTHHAAALVIGRRLLKVSERVPRHLDAVPDGKGGHVALSVPVRNRDKHVWSSWGIINRKLRTVHAAHFRARNRSSSS